MGETLLTRRSVAAASCKLGGAAPDPDVSVGDVDDTKAAVATVNDEPLTMFVALEGALSSPAFSLFRLGLLMFLKEGVELEKRPSVSGL